jgi:hypothetical protein
MRPVISQAVKRLTLVIIVACGLGGCVAYVPAAPNSYTYYDAHGNLVSVTPQVVPAPVPVPASVYVQPAYVQPAYVGPAYVAMPPVFFNFGYFHSWGGPYYHRGYYGRGGYYGHHR